MQLRCGPLIVDNILLTALKPLNRVLNACVLQNAELNEH